MTAWARLSEANAGLTGTVSIACAHATSSVSRPARPGPNISAVFSGRARLARAAISGVPTGLVSPRFRRVVARPKWQSDTDSATVEETQPSGVTTYDSRTAREQNRRRVEN